MEQTETIRLDIDVQFYYEGRDMPVSTPMTILFPKTDLPESIEDITDMAATLLYEKLDSRACHTLIIEDSMHNKRLIPVESFESFCVIAPNRDDLPDELSQIPLHSERI